MSKTNIATKTLLSKTNSRIISLCKLSNIATLIVLAVTLNTSPAYGQIEEQRSLYLSSSAPDTGTPTIERSSFFSADGKWFVYFDITTSELKSISLTTGEKFTLFTESSTQTIPFDLFSILTGSINIQMNTNDDVFFVVANKNPDSSLENVLYKIPVDGSQAAKQLGFSSITGGSVFDYKLSPTGGHVVVSIEPTDPLATIKNEIYSIETAPPFDTVKLNQPLPEEGQSVNSKCFDEPFKISPDGNYVVYMANPDNVNEVNLYAVDIGGTQDPVKLNLDIEFSDAGGVDSCFDGDSTTLTSNAGIIQYDFSDDSSYVFYTASERGRTSKFGVYRVPTIGGESEILYRTDERKFTDRMSFLTSRDSEYVVINTSESNSVNSNQIFSSRQANLDLERLYSGDAFSPAALVGITSTSSVVYSVFGSNNGINVATLNGQSNFNLIQTEQVIDVQLASNDSGVFFLSDSFSRPGRQSLLRLNINGGPLLYVGRPNVANGTVENYQLSIDGSRVVYLSDKNINNKAELFTRPSKENGTTTVNSALNEGEDVNSYLISPDGRFIAYQTVRRLDSGNFASSLTMAPVSNSLPTTEAFCFPVKTKSSKVSVTCL